MHQGANAERTAPCADALVQAILDVLRLRTGCDFSRYRRATMHRRIRNRMIALGIASLPEYLARIEDAEDEALPLLERLTIKVSRFYRNRATFDLLRTHVLPHLARDRGGAALRMWSAGCGCGEEAYSLAMLLEEAALPGFVVASDIDPAALDAARAAAYPAEALAELPPELRERFLRARPDGRYSVDEALRARVRLVAHDLTGRRPAPGAEKYDLVCCRNVLIYLQREAQERLLHRLSAVIAPGGWLCLGEAEWPAPLVPGRLVPLGRTSHLFRLGTDRAQGAPR